MFKYQKNSCRLTVIVRHEMLLSRRTLRLRFCRGNGARSFFRLRRRREFAALRVSTAEARDLRLVMRLLVGPLRLLVAPRGRSLLPLRDCRRLLLDRGTQILD